MLPNLFLLEFSRNLQLQLEETFIECSKTKGQDTKHERKRVEKELKHVKDQIAGIWRLQAARKMSEEALKSTSEELNSLAMEKTNLENRLLHLQEEESLVNSIKQGKFIFTPKTLAGEKLSPSTVLFFLKWEFFKKFSVELFVVSL